MTVNISDNSPPVALAQEKVEANVQPEKQEVAGIQQQSNATESEGDPNWRAFREARKKDRAEREAAERKAAEKEAEVAAYKAAMEAAFAKGSPSPQAYQQYYGMNQEPAEETEDQKIDRKVKERFEALEKENARRRYESEMAEYPTRLVKNYPDFNNVISQENRDYLDYHYPEVSRTLSRLPDGYDKWSDVYHTIKKLIPNNANARKEAVRADINSNKPKSISSTGLTQSQNAPGTHILSEERKAANWARMQQNLKGIG